MTKDLLKWFKTIKRDLPWRKNRNAYRVWLSEVMLQQTQVKTVIPYFERWLSIFPDVHSLAKAPLDDVLKQWEGLGYYRRAKNMHKAAQDLAFNRNGIFPTSYKGWLELSGIGPYSAAAIASIVTKEVVVAVDGNVKRVAARLFMLSGEANEKDVKAKLSPFISKDDPGSFNEAMMELGATLCKKQNPLCLECPLKNHCLAFQNNCTQDYPHPKLKKARPHYQKYALIDIQDNKIWLKQRSETEMLNGLWGFVLLDEKPKGKAYPKVKHAYTHFSLEVTPIEHYKKDLDGEYIELEKLERLALSTLDHKILNALDIKP